MLNLWNFTPSSLTSCQVRVCSGRPPNFLWLMLPTPQRAAILPGQFKCQASGSVATGSHTEPLTWLYQHSRLGSCTHRIKKVQIGWDTWLQACQRSSSETWRGCPVIKRAEPCLNLASQQPEREREGDGERIREWMRESRLAAGALAGREICGVAPPFHWAGISQGVWRLWG